MVVLVVRALVHIGAPDFLEIPILLLFKHQSSFSLVSFILSGMLVGLNTWPPAFHTPIVGASTHFIHILVLYSQYDTSNVPQNDIGGND